MTINQKTDHTVDHVLVSQASRNDAKTSTNLRFETYADEHRHYVHIKKQCEMELAKYSKAAMCAEQARIRAKYKDDKDASFNAWISRKSSMEHKRRELIERIAKNEVEIMRLKPLVKAESVRS